MKFKYCVSILLLGCLTPCLAQNVIQVEAGQNTILEAMSTAQSGDIIELTTDGGEYWNDDEIRIQFPVTIRAAAEIQNRPVLRNNSDENTKDIIRIYDSCTLIGLELDGLSYTDTLKAKYLIRTADDGTEVAQDYVFKAFDCYFHDVVLGSDGNAFRAYYQTFADTVIFQDCIFINTGKEAVRFRDEENERPNFGFYSVNYFEATNCTFANTVHDAISIYGGDAEPLTPGPIVRLNHLTLNKCGHYGINLKFVDDAEVKNSIITNNLDFVNSTGNTVGGPWLSDNATISFCDTLNIGGDWTGGNPQSSNILNVDPQYADPDNFDFTLSATSPVLEQADDGSDLGDKRWARNVTSVSTVTQSQRIETFSLKQNYPNPFNAGTLIVYQILEPGNYSVTVNNILGQVITTLKNGFHERGEYKLSWQGHDVSGLPTSSGVYFLRVKNLETGVAKTRKMLFIQ